MMLTYYLGKLLFSQTAGFWAALVVATTYVFLEYGRWVLFDSALTFFMTLALLAFVLAYTQPTRRHWYVLSFVAMALGTMTKAFHAFLLPTLLMVTFLLLQKDYQPFTERALWTGICVFLLVTISYYWVLGSAFREHFFLAQHLDHFIDIQADNNSRAGRPMYWYLFMIWFDFFPWSALLPVGIIHLFAQKPLRAHRWELFVLLWILGFLLALSLAHSKREPYLLPLVPGVGLMIGSYYSTKESVSQSQPEPLWLLKSLLFCLIVTYGVALWIGPSLLYRQWYVPPFSVFPPLFILIILILCGSLLYALLSTQIVLALRLVGLLAIGFAFAFIQFVLPTLDQLTSARRISDEIKSAMADTASPLLFYGPQSGIQDQEKFTYYLNLEHSIPYLRTEKALLEAMQSTKSMLVLMEKASFVALTQRSDLSLRQLREFWHKRYLSAAGQALVLALIQAKTGEIGTKRFPIRRL